MGFFTRLLDTLIDPNLLSLLFLAGIGGLAFEVFHPGVVLPGALGAVALVIALFGFSVLPTNWAGVALILLGLVLLVIDAHVVTHGALTLSGLDRAGSRDADALPRRAGAVPRRTPGSSLAVTASIGGFMAFALGKAVRRGGSRRRCRRSSAPEASCADDGLVFVRGELWQASVRRTARRSSRERTCSSTAYRVSA